MVRLILDKIDFKTKTLRDKGECFIMVKVSIHQQDIIIINVSVSKNRAPKTHEAKTFKTEWENRQFNNNIWSPHFQEWIEQLKDQQGDRRPEHYKANRPNRYP